MRAGAPGAATTEGDTTMSMVTAMYSGASALSAYGNAMGVIGNNLANNNTTAYKASNASFSDILSQAVGSTVAEGSNQLGNGVSMAAISQNMEQGSFQYTGVVTDLAIDGNGFFVVNDYSVSDTNPGTMYTRAGDFVVDRDGRLVTRGALRVQGVALTGTGEPNGSMSDITFGSVTSSSQPTGVASVSVNLDSSAQPPGGTYDPHDPSTYNFSTSVRVYDSLGNGHTVEVHFVKTADNTWEWHPVVTSAELAATYGDSQALTAVDLFSPAQVADRPAGAGYMIRDIYEFDHTPPAGAVSADINIYATDGTTLVRTVSGNAVTAGIVNTQENLSPTSYQILHTPPVGATDVTVNVYGEGGTIIETFTDSSFTAGEQNSLAFNLPNAEFGRYRYSLTYSDGSVVENRQVGFVNSGPYRYEVAYYDASDAPISTSAQADLTNLVGRAGRLEFTSSGALLYEGTTPITFNWANGAAAQEVLFDFGDALGANATDNADSTDDFVDYERDVTNAGYLTFVTQAGVNEDRFQTGTEGTVQFAAGFATLELSQDGFPAGYLEGLSVDASGRIYGSFTNGQVKPLYQLMLANFPNDRALDMVGHNLFAETWTSGQALYGYATDGEFGSIVSHSLEQSNVDISEEFVRMITIQRAFQANSRIVSVTDTMLEELINLKR